MNVHDLYKKKLTTAEEIVKQFQSGWVSVSDNALSAPRAIYEAIGKRAEEGNLDRLTMHTFLDVFPVPCYDEKLKDKIFGVCWFAGKAGRAALEGGFADVMYGHYRDCPDIITDFVDIDAFCIMVSPMDKHGYFSTGCSASLSVAMRDKARRIYLEVNKYMPRAVSGPIIHISQVTSLCENHQELLSIPSVESDEVSITIGKLIAEEIPNGATFQLGIGAIPNEVAKALKSKRDLGIHTEMFTDGMLDLLECGAVNNSRKPVHTGRTVATFAYGTRRIYDYIDDNPAIQMLPVDYVNNVELIAQHPNFVSVNAALEVDFLGQISAETIGTRIFSGSGGQVDYVRGSYQSKGGKSFIAFPSTSKNDTISKISSVLKPGSVVTTLKNEVDYIVTEYGIAKMRGSSLSQRTKALISIAHPKFRDELTFEAKKRNIVI